MDIQHYITKQQKRTEGFLDEVLPKQKNELHMAMRYASLNGGKRFRPLLVYTAGEAFNADPATLDHVAAAVELVHCYALIHDDLPCMDDDDFRRGQPSCHKAFNEAVAILAGDALQTFAFELLTRKLPKVTPEIQVHLIKHLAKASGANGMVLGQSLDINPDEITNLESITSIHLHKTGALIQASVLMGAHAGCCEDPNKLKALTGFGHELGLAYQIQDDILDLVVSAERIAEAEGAATEDNCNFSQLLGTDAAQEEVTRCYERALDKLKSIGLGNSSLAQLSLNMMNRDS